MSEQLEHPPGEGGQPRLSVLISHRTEAALLDLVVREDVSWTEATRRLVGYGHVVYEATRAGREVILRGGGQPTERVSLTDRAEGRS